MNKLHARLALITVAFAVAGCQSDQQVLASTQSEALGVAVKRGQFELNCPAATGSVLSSQMAQPVLEGPLLRGPERAEYTIGVSGCEKRATYVVICPQDGSGGCFAAEGQ